jgi:NADPH:quinone reductase-like Zn-dependent oxidoreductase
MRAAVQHEQGGVPQVVHFEPPQQVDDAVLIDVTTVGLGAWDVLAAYREPIDYPCVLRGEGVGVTADGRRVYFGERSIRPFGGWAERTVVPAAEVWDVPDHVDDRTAITMAIAGTGALVPLEQANIKPGESVLVLGATGALGQIAVQLARVLGAGRVVGAGRDRRALDRLVDRGWVDGVAQLGGTDDVASLKTAEPDGYDVVLDIVYGSPFVAALKASRWGARLMSIGTLAGSTATIRLGDLLFRTHTCVGTGQRSPADRRAIWERLLALAVAHNITVDYAEFTLDAAADAWQAQISSPHAKIVATVS